MYLAPTSNVYVHRAFRDQKQPCKTLTSLRFKKKKSQDGDRERNIKERFIDISQKCFLKL